MSALSTADNQPFLPRRLEELVDSELREGEHVLWLAQPIRRLCVRRSLPVLFIAIPWTAIVAYWMLVTSGAGIVALGGLPFLIGGIWMLTIPLWVLRRAGHLAYVVTDQRAVIFDSLPPQRVRSYSPEQLEEMQIRERSEGAGDIIFERVGWSSHMSEVGFLAIPSVETVETLLRQIIRTYAEQ